MSHEQVQRRPGGVDGEVVYEQVRRQPAAAFEYVLRLADGSVDYRPRYGDYEPLGEIFWPEYGEPAEYGEAAGLFERVRGFIARYVYLPAPRMYDACGAFVLASYRREEFDTATYLNAVGPVKSGKTRLLQLLELICFRGFKVASISPPPWRA